MARSRSGTRGRRGPRKPPRRPDGGQTAVQTIDPLWHITTLGYDDANRRTSVMNPLRQTVLTTYDAAGRAVESTNGLGFVTTTTYDNANRAMAVTNPEKQGHDPLEVKSAQHDLRPRRPGDRKDQPTGLRQHDRLRQGRPRHCRAEPRRSRDHDLL